MKTIPVLFLLGFSLFLFSGNALAATQTFEGELETTDPYWTTQHGALLYYYDTEVFQVAEDGWYRIEIVEAGLDDGFNNTYLTLLDKNQAFVTGDDNSGDDFLSMIEFQLTKDMDYYFTVGTLFPETTGDWEVTISSIPIPTAGLLMGSGLIGLAGLRRRT